jgi:hypothetical protein
MPKHIEHATDPKLDPEQARNVDGKRSVIQRLMEARGKPPPKAVTGALCGIYSLQVSSGPDEKGWAQSSVTLYDNGIFSAVSAYDCGYDIFNAREYEGMWTVDMHSGVVQLFGVHIGDTGISRTDSLFLPKPSVGGMIFLTPDSVAQVWQSLCFDHRANTLTPITGDMIDVTTAHMTASEPTVMTRGRVEVFPHDKTTFLSHHHSHGPGAASDE